MNNVVAIIQARMGSTRLPGKVMKDLLGKPVLGHVIERVGRCETIQTIVVATTDGPMDDPIADLARQYRTQVFRGSEADVLSRYYHAAVENHAETVVRITSDCPLFDPIIGDDIIRFYQSHTYDIVSNAGPLNTKRTYPPGTDTEVFSMAGLADAYAHAVEAYQREHVTPYIYEKKTNRVFHYQCATDFSDYRLTLDTPEDFQLIQTVYQALYRGTHDFYLSDIMALLETNPELREINQNVRQKHYTQIQ